MTTLLITGVSSYWGQRVATELAQQTETELRLLGLDRRPPQNDIPGLDFIRGNLSNPLMVDLLTAENVETVLYLDASESGFQFLPMCAEAGVHRVILKSSTTVYGAHPGNSLYLAETHTLDPKPRGSLRPLVELETFANGLAAQHPGLSLTILRFAHILGPTAETPLARFLLDDRAPTLLGFNPLFQLIHEDDVVAALVHATLNDLPGAYNIAAEDAHPLNKILALVGKLPLPIVHPLAASLPTRLTPLPVEHLRYPCLASLDRMNNDFGLTPAHTAEETVTEFATEVRVAEFQRTRYMPDALEKITNPIRDLVQSLRRTGGEDNDNE
ncbi:MAG TPA: NAD-dependent epimerase/dehydratase family protein [Anaerolineales bacterium]|nr:NAD-dependent epimerase/dehydratase family protein [Anaerolineales bacterium]